MSKPLTIQQVAERLGVSPNTVRDLIEQHAFPNAYKTGFAINSHWRIPEEDVDNFLHRQREGGRDDPR